jgi:hypothetical protein
MRRQLSGGWQKLPPNLIGPEREVFHDPILVEPDSPTSYFDQEIGRTSSEPQKRFDRASATSFMIRRSARQLEGLPLTLRRPSLFVIGPGITHEFVLEA